MMLKELNIGLIQPTYAPQTAWGENIDNDGPYEFNMYQVVSESIWSQVAEALNTMVNQEVKPHIVLIPELHISHSRIPALQSISCKHGLLIIAGIDFTKRTKETNKIMNNAKIFIPNKWPLSTRSNYSKILMFGKTNFSYMEKHRFANQVTMPTNINPNPEPTKCFPDPEPNMYILKTKEFGNFGLMICSDFFDIERYLLYQGKIHHLLLIANNKDLSSYDHLAESLTRLLFANVVVCNTGAFGGSVVHSPYRDSIKRTIYRHTGSKLFTYQTVQVPVKALDEAQNEDITFENRKKDRGNFKALPPGYKKFLFPQNNSLDLENAYLNKIN